MSVAKPTFCFSKEWENMDLKDKINADLKTAMLARNNFETTVFRGLKAAILNEEVKLGKRESGLTDAEIKVLIAREVKKRKEAAALLDEERAQNELKKKLKFFQNIYQKCLVKMKLD